MMNIHFCGDVYVSATKSEGIGLGAITASSYNKPVIITKYGAQYEYLKNGVEHALEYFSKELLDLINNYPKIRIELIHLELLNDISEALQQQLLFTKEVRQLDKFKQFLLSL